MSRGLKTAMPIFVLVVVLVLVRRSEALSITSTRTRKRTIVSVLIPLRGAFIPAMSVCDERAGKMGWIEVAGAVTSGTVSPLHPRFAHFRQWHVDANDGSKLGDERTYEQSDSAWVGELRCGLASADTCSGGRLIG